MCNSWWAQLVAIHTNSSSAAGREPAAFTPWLRACLPAVPHAVLHAIVCFATAAAMLNPKQAAKKIKFSVIAAVSGIRTGSAHHSVVLLLMVTSGAGERWT
jgi:hypothetical protein